MEWAFKGPCDAQGAASAASSTPTPSRPWSRGRGGRGVLRQAGAAPLPGGRWAGASTSCASSSSSTTTATPAPSGATCRSGDELYRRLRELPGYGEEKAKIFMAILAKRLGKRPTGWEEAAAPFSDEHPRSVADIDSAPSRWPRSASARRPRRPQARPRPTEAGTDRARAISAGRSSWPVALAVEPAEQHGHGPGIVAQLVAGPVDDAQLGVAVGVGQHPGVEHRHRLVVGPVHARSSGRGYSCGRRRPPPGSRGARGTTRRRTAGRSGERMMPTSRACSSRRRGWLAQSSKSAGAAMAATPRTRVGRPPPRTRPARRRCRSRPSTPPSTPSTSCR